MVEATNTLYWLCKQDLPNTTKYVPLLELAKSLGSTYLIDLHLGGNAHYTSERFFTSKSIILIID